MTHDEMIAVIQAHKDGKTIQARNRDIGVWDDVDPIWRFDSCDYRVKPEPREWILNPEAGICVPYDTLATTEIRKNCVHVREVLDD